MKPSPLHPVSFENKQTWCDERRPHIDRRLEAELWTMDNNPCLYNAVERVPTPHEIDIIYHTMATTSTSTRSIMAYVLIDSFLILESSAGRFWQASEMM